VQKIFDLPQPKRISDIHHHRLADDFRRVLKYRKGLLLQECDETAIFGSSEFSLTRPARL
jgi:hypothetical protein